MIPINGRGFIPIMAPEHEENTNSFIFPGMAAFGDVPFQPICCVCCRKLWYIITLWYIIVQVGAVPLFWIFCGAGQQGLLHVHPRGQDRQDACELRTKVALGGGPIGGYTGGPIQEYTKSRSCQFTLEA